MQVTIASRSVPNYVHSSRKHVEVRAASGQLVFTVSALQITKLAIANAIEGVVDPKKKALKHVRLIVSARDARRIIGTAKSCSKQLPVAEDNRTITRERLNYTHHAARCAAYDPRLRMVN